MAQPIHYEGTPAGAVGRIRSFVEHWAAGDLIASTTDADLRTSDLEVLLAFVDAMKHRAPPPQSPLINPMFSSVAEVATS